MIAYGFPRGDVTVDLDIAQRLSATSVEVLPDWRQYPDPHLLRTSVDARGLVVHSAHGCWGGQAISADRVDLADLDEAVRRSSVDDVKRCVDWLASAGGRCLVVHPGGLSLPADFDTRRAALAASLERLADHARGTNVTVCVENMPPGVHPGSRMADLSALIAELNRPELALALDTGHAQITSSPAGETLAGGALIATTHVHDNDGKHDTHDPPGLGMVDWDTWVDALDTIGYRGPIMLECIRYLRQNPASLNPGLLERLRRMTQRD
jgi:sugar phosphate isomerase/epimerase